VCVLYVYICRIDRVSTAFTGLRCEIIRNEQEEDLAENCLRSKPLLWAVQPLIRMRIA
jgi:hypothetical protein